MSKLNLDSIFSIPEKNTSGRGIPNTYDVLITLTSNGNGRECIRFAFNNKAASVFGEHPYIEMSDVNKLNGRLYFRSHDEKVHAYVYKLTVHKRKRTEYCQTAFTRDDEIKNIYKKNWLGTHKLYFDEENELYYISSN